MKKWLHIFFLLTLFYTQARAQDAPIVEFYNDVVDGDSVLVGHIHSITVFRPIVFKNDKQREAYSRLVYDVRKVYPYAQLIAQSIIETYQTLQALPDDDAREAHMKEVEKYMMDTYKPKMKKLTRRQGEILIKLIDRESNSSSYEIVKALVGSFRAGAYNLFAGMFGNSLKTRYDPTGKDAAIERIVIEINEGVY